MINFPTLFPSFELLQGIAILLNMCLCVSLLLLGISLFIPCLHGNEVQTLIAFRAYITADPYDSLEDWTPNSPTPCNWNGIGCCDPDSPNNCSSFVQVIDLPDCHLNGHISPFIGNLCHLRQLNLSNNNLLGSIPASFGMLSNLVWLDLSYNSLSGVIPSEVSKMPFLEILDLSSNDLSGSIPFFQNLSSLSTLDLSHNRFSGVIPSVQNLSSLRFLDLSYNRLNGVIPPFQNLFYLETLDLSHNYLSGVISSFQSKSLCTLDLSHNGLNGSIPPFQSMSFFSSLDLSHNNLNGVIPRFQNLFYLHTVNLSHNYLNGVTLFQNLYLLYSLDLSHNCLSRAILPHLGSLKNLYFLDLSHNLLNSDILFAARSLSSGCSVDLSSNNLTGTIPNNLSKILSRISERNVRRSEVCCYNYSNNALSGSVPYWVLSVTKFQLDLSYNDFEGTIPCIESSITKILNGNSRLHSSCAPNNRAKEKDFINKGKGKGFILILGIVLGGLAALCLSGLLWLLIFHKLKLLQNNKAISWVDQKFIRLFEQQLAVATDNFSEHNLVGIGGSARIYRGVLPILEFVAVKVFYGLDLQEDDDNQQAAAHARFMRECQTLGQIRHRNLVKIITACCGENIRALILQYMPNGNLRELLHLSSRYGRLMPLSLKTRLLFIKDIASALSYLHNDCCPPIIHCDVKPHNVLLNEDMVACLSDFGMAKILQPSDMAPSLRLEGSVGYIAPEYGTGVEPCSRGDVYSFGVLVLEVLTRTRPTNEEILGEQRLSDWVSMALMQGTEHWYPLICGREGQHEISALSNANISVLEELLKMGVWCCCQEPHARPTMREVEGLIGKICIEVVEETRPLHLKSTLSGFLITMDTKPQGSKHPRASDSSTF